MSSKKNTDQKTATERSHQLPPSTPDEFLALDNRLASDSMPEELEEQAERIKLYLPAKHTEPPKFVQSREISKTWELELQAGSIAGLPGLNASRLSHQEISREIQSSIDTEPFLPSWIDYTPHPKIATASRPLLRRRDGRLIQPHYGVFGADDRQVYYPSGYPWSCIGRLLVWNDASKPNPSSSGSAVLVGGRVILTAGHMAPTGSKNWAMQFIPAYYDGASTLGNGVLSWVSDYNGYQDPVSAWDMLVCRLYTPLGNSYGYFGAKTYDDDWEGGNYWTLAGYPGAVAGANRPSRQMWWPVVDDDSDGSADELEYYADQTPGDSGGPVFGFWSGQPYVIGTASGGQKETFLWWTTEDDNVAAGGSAMVNLIKWARSNWT